MRDTHSWVETRRRPPSAQISFIISVYNRAALLSAIGLDVLQQLRKGYPAHRVPCYLVEEDWLR